MAALSDHQSWRRGTSATHIQPQLPLLPETVEEEHEEDRHREAGGLEQREDLQLRQIEDDLQSELSFASAYSNPRDSSDTFQRMESTV